MKSKNSAWVGIAKMCSVTIHRKSGQITITMNRDENLERLTETSPQQYKNSIYPTDPQSGGTWVGVAKNGRWACLLNGYIPNEVGTIANSQSRGRIIPEILATDDMFECLRKMDLKNTYSFRLLVGN